MSEPRVCCHGDSDYGRGRKAWNYHHDSPAEWDLCCDLADARARLVAVEKANGEAVEALRPFAMLLHKHHRDMDDSTPIFEISGDIITVGDIRRAARIVEGATAKETR